MPSNSYRQHHLKYNLSDPKAFHKLIQWVEAVQGYNKDEETGEVHSANLFYHPTHHSCSVFASALRDRAIELGAKPQSLSRRKISNLTTVFSRFKEWLLNFFITNPLGRKKFQWDQGVEFGGIKNYNITHLDPKGLYLPLDLILDHQKLVSKK